MKFPLFRYIYFSAVLFCFATSGYSQVNVFGITNGQIFCINDAPVTISATNPGTKTFYGPGITSTGPGTATFKPSVAGVGTHSITYDNPPRITITVTVSAFPATTLAPFTAVCVNAPAFVLAGGSPVGGTYSGTGVDVTGNFNPALAGAGIHPISYTNITGTCSSTAIQNITVNALPTVSLAAFPIQCESGNSIVLNQGVPVGGTYSGTGIAGGSFFPTVAGIGTFPIAYTYNNGNCVNSASGNITVSPLPVVSFSGLSATYCESDPADLLTGVPTDSKGKFTGSGVFDNGNGTAGFVPSIAGLGNFTITYTYTDANACSQAVSQTVQVGTPLTLNGIDPTYCADETNVAIVATPAGGSYTATLGLIDNANGTATFNPSIAGAGTHSIEYIYNDGTCANIISRNVEVVAIPTPAIVGLSSLYCINGTPITISGNYTPGGNFLGSGITDNGNGTATFNPSILLVGGPYTVNYAYTNASGCAASSNSQTTIKPLPTATISGNATICQSGNTPVTVNLTGTIPYDFTYTTGFISTNVTAFGANLFTANVSPVSNSNYTVTSVTDGNGCTNAGMGTAVVNVNPQVSITTHPSDINTCIGSNSSFSIVANGVNLSYQWRKDGVPIAGAVNPVILLNNISAVSIGVYTCVVSSTCGGPLTSNAATLTIQTVTGITTHPTDEHLCTTDNLNLQIVASGTNLTYQWKKNTVNIPGKTSSSLTINGVTTADNGIYTCEVTGNCGIIESNPANVLVDAPIVITAQPSNIQSCPGNNVSFNLAATGTNLTYQWQKNGIDIVGQTSQSLVINNIVAGDAGNYRCVISSPCGATINSLTAVLTVLTSLTIITQPIGSTVCQGANSSLTIAATGSLLTYQWYKNGVALVNGGVISGATTNVLVFTGLLPATAGIFLCRVSSACGTLDSDPATVVVDNTISITSQPASQTACDGNNVSYTVTATGSNLTYQWQKNGVNIAGAINATLNVNSVTALDNGNYRCILSNSCGATLNSSVASLTIYLPTQISSQPVNAVECIGNSINITTSATGSNLSYQWLKGGIAIVNGGDISGALTNNLIIANLDITDAGIYYCSVSGSCGIVNSDPATLSVSDNIAISIQPVNVQACNGNNVSFAVTATGSDLSYQWQKSGVNIAGATSSVLTLLGIDATHVANYRCVITNSCGTSLASQSAPLTLYSNTSITLQPVDIIACVGGNASFTIGAAGDNLSYQWRKNGVDLVNGGNLSGALTNTITFTGLIATDNGIYTCEAFGSCGAMNSSPADLILNANTLITIHPASQNICEGGNAVFNVTATGSNITYQWQKNGISIPGATNSGYIIPNITTSDAGVFRCVISGSCGTINSNGALLTIDRDVVITSQPITDEICETEASGFSVSATGTSLTYHWRFNGVNLANGGAISGSTTQNLTINPAMLANNGNYSCVISGTCSNETSNTVQLVVNQKAVITVQPQNQVACPSGNVVFFVTASGTGLTYQWQKNGINLPAETNASLLLNNVTAADAGLFRCIVTGTCGIVNSNAASLSINQVAFISIEPIDVDVCEGENADFTIVAGGTGLSYQWKLSGANIIDGGTVSGATTGNLRISSASLADAGAYVCEITGSCGTVNSLPASLVVNENIFISAQPMSNSACPGDNIVFNVVSNGTNLTYQWQKNGVNIPGETNSGLLLNTITNADAAIYRCVIAGNCGNLISTGATLTVNTDVSITSQPSEKNVCAGSSAGFVLTAAGTGLNYNWMRNNVSLVNGGEIQGVNTNSLSIDPVSLLNAGIYTCEITGTCGAVNSNPVNLTVQENITIIAHPSDLNACPGEIANFSVMAGGTNLSYQWQKNGVDIAGQTNAGLSLAAVTAVDQGVYRCVITGSCGTLSSNGALLTIEQIVLITLQPTANPVLCEGDNLDLSVISTGTSLSYQWQKDGVNISNGGNTSGALSDNLLISNTDVSNDGIYTCLVTGSCGSENSNLSDAIINATTAIITHPVTYTIVSGGNATFSVLAEGANLTYQWQKDGINLTNGGVVSGAQSSSLMLTVVVEANEGAYRCIVTGTCSAVNSNPANLIVNPTTNIITQPLSLIRCEGESATFSIVAGGTGNTFQWRKDGVNLVNNANISGATSANLNISITSPTSAGAYTCIVNAESSAPAILTVNENAVIIFQPASISRCEGDAAIFSIIASGSSLSYQWQKGGVNLVDGGTISGATTSVLSLSLVATTDAAIYRCLVTGLCAGANSNPANLLVYKNTLITVQPIGNTICEGSPKTFTISAEGDNMSYVWKKNGTNLIDGGNITGVSTPNLIISSATSADAGSYTCMVLGVCGNENSIIAQLVVEETTEITLQPINASGCSGDNVNFSVLANGTNLSYQWQKNGINLVNGGSFSGTATSNFSISGILPADNATYVCVINGNCGTVNSDPSLLIANEIISITSQPLGTIICEGQTSTISIVAIGSNLTYQWKKGGVNLSDGGNISGTHTANLNITNAVSGDNATYYCEITGVCGTIISNLAVLEVRSITQITQQPIDVTGCSGDNSSFSLVALGHNLSYQWQKNGANIANGGSVSGVMTNQLSISGIVPSDAGSYRCVVSGTCNSLNSNTATLSSFLTSSILLQPTGTAICEGNSVALNVTGDGNNLTYQWKKNAIPLINAGNISGANTANLSIANTLLSDAGTYTVELSGECGIVNSNFAQVIVDSTTQIIINPINVQSCEGDNISFSILAVGNSISFQWQKDGVNLSNVGTISGVTSPLLTINGVVPTDDGSYRCVVTGGCGIVNSNPAILASYSNTQINLQPIDRTVCEGDQVTLTIIATGNNLNFRWKHDGVVMSDGINISGSLTSNLILNNTTDVYSGIYTCEVAGSCGTENSSPSLVTIRNETIITAQPQNKTTCEGDVAVFAILASGDGLTYQWQKNGAPMTDGGNIFGSTTTVLTVNNHSAADAGVYRCIVTGSCGPVNSDAAILTVLPYPGSAGVIIGPLSVCQGVSNIIFEVASITNADSYIWNLPVGVSIISGAGTRVIEVAFSNNELGGNITVQGNNSCGTGALSAIHAVVAHPIPAALAGSDQNICVDNTILAAANPGTANGTWTVLDGPATIQNVSLNTSVITNLREGSNTLIWTVAESGCASSDTVLIRNNHVDADAGTDVIVCTQSITLQGNALSTGATGNWSVQTGMAGFSQGDSPVSQASAFSTGITILRWTITKGNCTDYDSVIIDNQAPSQSFAGIDQSICGNATLAAANSPLVGTGNWTVVIGSTTFGNTSIYNTSFTNLGKGTNILRWTISNGICSSIDEVTISNNQVTVNAGVDQVLCDRTTDLAAAAPVTGVGNWSVILGAAAFVNNNLYNTRVTNLVKGDNILAWNINNNGCISTDTVKITNDSPTAANAGTDQIIMADFTTLQGNIPTVGIGTWSLIAGSAVIVDPFLYNTNVTALALGENTFRWTISHNSCISFDEVKINNFTPTNTNAGPDQTICSTSAKMAANEPLFGFGEWSVIKGSATFFDNSKYNTNVTGLAPGDNILRWTIWQNGYSSDDVVISNDSPTQANAGSNQTLCSESTTLSANDPIIGIGQWSVVSGAGVFNSNLVFNTQLSGMAKGENIYKWTVINKSCMSSDLVTVNNDLPTVAYAGEDQLFLCLNSAILNPNTPSVGTGYWSVISGSANFVGNVASNLAVGSNTLRWTIANNACSTYDEILLVNNQPSEAQAGADKIICSDSITLAANSPLEGNGVWTIQNGSATINDISDPNTFVSNLGQGINVFRWTISKFGCSVFDEVVVKNSLIKATTGLDQEICQPTTLLEANNPAEGMGQWTVLGGSGSAIFEDSNQPDTRVSGLDKGANILRWTIVYDICESFVDVVINNNQPTLSYAGPDEAICQSNTNLRAGVPLIGIGEWSILSGSAVINSPNSAVSSISNLSYGTNTLRWTISNKECTSTDEVVIANNATIVSIAGDDLTICSDSTALFGNNPPFGIGQWSVVSGSATFQNTISYNTTVRNLGKGINVLRWYISNGNCSSSDEVSITNNSPTKSIAGADQSLCGSTTDLFANIPTIGNGRWILVSGAASFTDNTKYNTTVSGLNPGSNTLRWSIEHKGCFSTDDAVITNNLPYVADAGLDMELCKATASLFANDPISGIGQWSVISGAGTFEDASRFDANISGLGFGINTLRWTISYDGCTTTDEINVTNNQIDLYAGIDQVVGESSTLLAANNPSEGNGQWLVIGGSGKFSDSNNSISTVSNLGSGLNTFRWSVEINGCISTDDVSVTYNVPPQASFVITTNIGCPPLEVFFVNNSMDNLSFIWDFDDGATSTDVTVKHTYTRSGIFTPTLTIFGNTGEIVTSDTIITVYDQPEASFLIVNREVYIPEEEALFINTSTHALTYLWDFGNGITSTEKDPKYIYQDTGSYDITLQVWSEHQCFDSVAQNGSVKVFESGTITFPNAFTPNIDGSNNGVYDPNDFSNDVFFPIGDGIGEYHLEIFNKWGILVFESNDLNIGWDGYYEGNLLHEGVYVWKVTGKYNNGKDFTKVGTVLLIH